MSLNPPAPARFYYSAPAPCPYVDGRIERRIFADLSGPHAAVNYDLLSEAGFRRSLGFAYRPACPGCNECVPVRIPVREFDWSYRWRRVAGVNADLSREWAPARATAENFELFQRYQRSRHAGGDMERMDYGDFRTMIEVGKIDSGLLQCRDRDGRLVAACLTDRMARGVSAVYSFYDPEQPHRSLGSQLVLGLVGQATVDGLDHVYLGYWISGSRKMAYKACFRPLEALTREGWRRLDRVALGG
jgi:arginine-tRNA-protein transferase